MIVNIRNYTAVNITRFFYLGIFVLFSTWSSAQLKQSQIEQIDDLFLAWNTPGHPGGAIGIMHQGKVVYSKAFGLASLEYLIPNSPGTIFNTGSVSKQFTAMGIVRLEEQGLLSFDDDVRKHIPELPDFGEVITIRHLLHHTSGLRSLHALFALAGWRGDDFRSNDDLNRIILDQKYLNFKPGDEFLYCNTGYMLMVNIIENATGEKFPSWMKENIFLPLGMIDTYTEDQYDRIVPNNATSYYAGQKFTRAIEYWGYVGSGNMHSTTGDLMRWLSFFHTPVEGWEDAFQTLQTTDPLNDGGINNYAFGVNVFEENGRTKVQHGGSVGGFRAYAGTYPDEQLSIVVLTNFSGGNPGGKAGEISGILLDNIDENDDSVVDIESIEMSVDELSAFKGTYWNAKEKYQRRINVWKDTLWYVRTLTNQTPLLAVDDNTFKMSGVDVDVTVRFTSSREDKQMTVQIGNESLSVFDKKEKPAINEDELDGYVGTFYSSELKTAYTITVDGKKIRASHIRHGEIPLQRIFPDVMTGDWPLSTIEFNRNESGQISGIYVSNGRVRNAWFEKQ